MNSQALQDLYAPHSACFGCGPSNEKGLQIKSIAEESRVVATWTAQKHHEAFPGMVNGGILGALLDCHSNWTAAWHLMKAGNHSAPPCTVTAEFSVKLLRPTPSTLPLTLSATVRESKSDRATIDAEIKCGDKVCATCVGIFVAVKPGHPAYHRW